MPSPRGIEEVRKVCGVVFGQCCGLEGGEVGEHDPVPARNHHVLHLYVAVAHTVLVSLVIVGGNTQKMPNLFD